MTKIILPGLIDPHVHLRDPGQTEKEDFYTGTCAAIAGGFTTILDMPNNKVPITTLERLEEKISFAKQKTVCNIGFYFGSLGDNLDEFEKVKNKVFGLKLYLNETTGNFLINKEKLLKIFSAWPSDKPILLHAEDEAVSFVIETVRRVEKRAHFCHISTASDLKQIIKAKEEGLPITCGVTPHHLFLTEEDVKTLGSFGRMKPPLRSKKDVDFLWKNLKIIDVVESDHAPHTINEKLTEVRGANKIFCGRTTDNDLINCQTKSRIRLRSEKILLSDLSTPKTPFGVPGLETTLPLLLTAAHEKRITIDDILRLCHTNPARIFGIETDPQTFIEVDKNLKFEIGLPFEASAKEGNLKFHAKCGWSPFDGWKVKGKVQKVFIKGKKVFENGKILAKKGSGKVISPNNF